MSKLLIPDKDEVLEILKQAPQHSSIYGLAKANGLRFDELESAIRYYDLDYPVFLNERELTIKEEFPRLQKQGLTLKQIALQFKMHPSELRRLITKLGLDVFNIFDKALDEALEVRHYLMTRGGTMAQAVSQLGLPKSRTTAISRQFKEMGFNPSLFRHVGKRQGHWLVLPAEPGQSDKHHRCLCTKCNTIHLVQKDNFANGSTFQCRSCGLRDRANKHRFPIENVGTGELFTSINAAHATVADEISAQCFYRRMRRDQTVSLDSGKRFRFVLPPGEEVSDKLYKEYFFSDVGPHYTPDQLLQSKDDIEQHATFITDNQND